MEGALCNTGNDLNNAAKTERDVRQYFTAAQPRSCERLGSERACCGSKWSVWRQGAC